MQSVWKYAPAPHNFYSYDDQATVGNKLKYVQAKQMRGLFSWTLGLEGEAISLTTAMSAVKP